MEEKENIIEINSEDVKLDDMKSENKIENLQNNKEKGNFGWAVLGFLVPIVGLTLFLVWRKDRPGDSKMAGIGALVSVILEVVYNIIYSIIFTPDVLQAIKKIMKEAMAFIF